MVQTQMQQRKQAQMPQGDMPKIGPGECLFCKIAKGEIPCKKVYEDEDVFAFLDINPANKGHTLVISKKHFENIFEVDEGVLEKMIVVVKQVATAVKDKLDAQGVNVMQNNGRYAGQLVSHIHFHVIPRFPNDRVLITYQRSQLSEEELNDVQKMLSEEGSSADSSNGMDIDL